MTETRTPDMLRPGPAERTGRGAPAVGVAYAVSVGFFVLALVGLVGLITARAELSDARAAGRADSRTRGEVLAAARTFATNLTTYDYRQLAADVARVAAGASGKFKAEYAVASGPQFQKLVTDNRALAKGSVLSAGLVTTRTRCGGTGDEPARDCDQAVVLLAVDQAVTNANTPTPRVDRNRIQLTLERIDGRWLAVEVQVL